MIHSNTTNNISEQKDRSIMPRLFASLSLMNRLWAGLLVLWFAQGLMAEELSAKGIEQLKQAA
jgi:hypothetical protein